MIDQKTPFRAMYVLLAICCFSCQTRDYISRQTISAQLKKQNYGELNGDRKAGTFDLPPGLNLKDGLSEKEAVDLALWNNARFQADLADIAIANAAITNAKIIQNPLLRYLSPASGISTSGYINFGLDFIWQRPQRIKAAKLNADRVADSLLQKGFLLIRDVQLAYTDVILNQQRFAITRELTGIRQELARLSNVRLKYGDISELEASTTRADSASAADALITAGMVLKASGNVLNNLLGRTNADSAIQLNLKAADTLIRIIPRKDYLALAFEYRPELRAAKTAIASAGSSLGWEKSKVITFTGTLNYQYLSNLGGNKWLPNAVNPGFQMDIPLFNRNQGNIQRARAVMEKAVLQYVNVQQAVALSVAQAYNRYESAYQSYQVWNTNTLPALAEAVRLV